MTKSKPVSKPQPKPQPTGNPGTRGANIRNPPKPPTGSPGTFTIAEHKAAEPKFMVG